MFVNGYGKARNETILMRCADYDRLCKIVHIGVVASFGTPYTLMINVVLCEGRS